MPETTKQRARKSGVSQRTIQRRIKAGKIRASKPGHDYIITGSASGGKKKGKKSGGKRGKKR